MFKIGEKLETTHGLKLSVKDGPWSGGQGSVFKVESDDGKTYALKWYHDSYLNNAEQSKALWDSLNKIMNKSVGVEFAWPIDFVKIGSSFGYVMEFVDFGKFITLSKMKSGARKYQPSLQSKILISLNICNAFSKLHAKGFCYRDINEGNIMFDIKAGEIKIVDNDNVGVEGYSTSDVRGVLDYMAPEILCDFENTVPSKYTDSHSIAVFLFQLWMFHHPLEGNNCIETRCFDRNAKIMHFGRDPKFIFADNGENALKMIYDKGTKDEADYSYVHSFWNSCPADLQKLFKKVFSEGLVDAKKRPLTNTWTNAFRKLYDMVLQCNHCGADTLLTDDKVCWNCQKTYLTPPMLRIKKKESISSSSLLLTVGKQLSDSHFGKKENVGGGNVIGVVVPHPTNPQRFGIQNRTNSDWVFINGDGKTTPVIPGKSVIVDPQNKIDFGNDYIGEFVFEH